MNTLTQLRNPYLKLSLNLLMAVGNSALGLFTHSWWFVTVGIYYAVLSTAHFCILRISERPETDSVTDSFVRKVTGYLLIALSFSLIGINILSAIKERGTQYHEIVMIAIAACSFTKITLAIIGMFKARRNPSQITKTLRSIAFADSFVSIYSLQRSMLVSFPGMQPAEVQLFNILTGTAVWMIVLLLGINLIGGKYVDMAKSRIAETNRKIAEAVTESYKKIEQGVVDGYKKIEQGVVEGYTKIEDKFIDAYLAREGETVEEARARLRKETK